jgi:hypothetical protein
MDYCAQKVKKSVAVWPSARASQMVAKCRKAHGISKRGKAGASLRRWQREKWKDVRTNELCGSKVKTEYCRPTKRISKKRTPVMHPSKAKVRKNYKRKAAGKRAARV